MNRTKNIIALLQFVAQRSTVVVVQGSPVVVVVVQGSPVVEAEKVVIIGAVIEWSLSEFYFILFTLSLSRAEFE